MSLRGAVGFADWGDKRNNKSSKNLLTKYVNGVNMNTTYERKNIMQFIICATSDKLCDSICDTNGIVLLHSISVWYLFFKK